MAGKIFINYRRGDDPGNTGRLFDRLQDVFEPQQLFLDVDNIAPGLDFVRELNARVAECDIVLAVIGKSWIDARDGAGKRRLEDPDDFVRIEIESALTQGKRVIPVLVGDAPMPRPEDLPDPMRPLARRNAVRLTHERFRADTQGLIKALQQALTEIEEFHREHARAEAERRAEEERRLQKSETARRAEEDSLRREAEQAAQVHAAEERRRQEAETRQRAEDEERRLWDEEQERRLREAAAQQRAEEEARREKAEADQRERVTEERRRQEAEARQRAAQEQEFSIAKRAGTVAALDGFLAAHPASAFTEQAQKLKASLEVRAEAQQRAAEERRRQDAKARRRAEEERAFAAAKRVSTVLALEAFLAAYPASPFADEAGTLKTLLQAREHAYRRAVASDDAAVLTSFLQTYRKGADADAVRRKLRLLQPGQTWPLRRSAIVVSAGLAAIALVVTLAFRSEYFRPQQTPPPSLEKASTAPPHPDASRSAPRAIPAIAAPNPPAEPTLVPPISSPPPTLPTEEIAWDLVKESKDPDQLRRFIDQFPNSAHSSEAEQLVARLTTTAKATGAPDPHELARALQFELKRVGCFTGPVNGEFDDPTKNAWRQFIKLTSISVLDAMSSEWISAIRAVSKRVCPLICPPGQHADGELCIGNAPAARPSAKPSHEPNQPRGGIVVDNRGKPPGTVTQGGVTTCGRNGCQFVPKNCDAVTGSRDNPGFKGLGGKIICP